MYRNAFSLLVMMALALSALGRPGQAEFDANMAKCAMESGIDPASFAGPPPPIDEAMNDPKIKCFGACIMKQRGHLNKDGTMNIEKAVEQLRLDIPDRDKVVEAIRECGTNKGENDCETAYEVSMCLREKNALPPMPH